MKFPPRVVACPQCGERFDADSDVLWFMGLGVLLGMLLGLALCG
jgi:hypothetical protein